MTTTYQLTLSLPDFDVDEQLDIFALLPTELDGVPVEWSTPARDLWPTDRELDELADGVPVEWSTPARDITTWQGMAEELAERLPDFEALTLPAQGMVIGAFLAELEATPGPLGATPERIACELDAAEGRRGRDRTRGTEGLARFLALEAVGMMAAWGVEA